MNFFSYHLEARSQKLKVNKQKIRLDSLWRLQRRICSLPVQLVVPVGIP